MRANVSLGPPKQAAQLGAAGVVQPAASKICAAVFPSHPATGKPYRSAHTCSQTCPSQNLHHLQGSTLGGAGDGLISFRVS